MTAWGDGAAGERATPGFRGVGGVGKCAESFRWIHTSWVAHASAKVPDFSVFVVDSMSAILLVGRGVCCSVETQGELICYCCCGLAEFVGSCLSADVLCAVMVKEYPRKIFKPPKKELSKDVGIPPYPGACQLVVPNPKDIRCVKCGLKITGSAGGELPLSCKSL